MDGRVPIRLLIILAADENEEAASNELRIERIAPPYYLFKDLSAEVVLATPGGGYPALSDDMRCMPAPTPAMRRFLCDRNARDDLADTLDLGQIVVDDFDAAFCIGFPGSVWGADTASPAAMIRSFLESGKPVAIVPGQRLDIAPDGAGSGLLIVDGGDGPPLLAAHALLKVVVERRRAAVKSG